jgi:hypothetical protein
MKYAAEAGFQHAPPTQFGEINGVMALHLSRPAA